MDIDGLRLGFTYLLTCYLSTCFFDKSYHYRVCNLCIYPEGMQELGDCQCTFFECFSIIVG